MICMKPKCCMNCKINSECPVCCGFNNEDICESVGILYFNKERGFIKMREINGLNADYKLRNEILGVGEEDEFHRFTNLSLNNLQELIDSNFIDLEECQNYSPTTEEFLNFMKENPGVVAHGYAVESTRNDYRVTLEGISYDGNVDFEELINLVDNFRSADIFNIDTDGFYLWWD